MAAGIAAILIAFLTTPVLAQDGGDKRVPATIAAKQLFGSEKTPASLLPKAIGSYARGCLAGAKRLPRDGPNWQAMRLSRNRHWGHPVLVDYLTRLARDAKESDDWPGLLIGDMAQPRGGPMLTGHKSHQIGLDADIWLRPSQDRRFALQERETISAISVRKNRYEINRRTWTVKHARLLRRAASYPEVARVFVHPTVKRELCAWAGAERTWLRKIRAWYGHHDHFHVRLRCPDASTGCVDQPNPPPGDGCGEELSWWFSDEPYKPKPKDPHKKPPDELRLDDLPQACQAVLNAQGHEDIETGP